METNKTTIASRIEYFETKYGPLVDCNLTGDKEFTIFKTSPRRCRFCEKSEPSVTFRKKAHAFPELIGNRILLSGAECDNCNSHFSQYLENHFANFLGPARTFSMTRGKSGVPSYKTGDQTGRVDVKSGKFSISVQDGSSLFIEDDKENLITFEGTKPTYIPNAVYKCLVKMALSIVPEDELANFAHARQWILQPNHQLPIMRPQPMFFSFRGAMKPFPFIKAYLLRRKPGETLVPYMQFFIAFDNYTFQIIVPSAVDAGETGTKVMEEFPTIYDLNQDETAQSQHALTDMSSAEPVRNAKVSITMSYDSKERLV